MTVNYDYRQGLCGVFDAVKMGTVPLCALIMHPIRILHSKHMVMCCEALLHIVLILTERTFSCTLFMSLMHLPCKFPASHTIIWAKSNWLALKILSMITDLPYNTEAFDCSSMLSYRDYDATLEPTINLFIYFIQVRH